MSRLPLRLLPCPPCLPTASNPPTMDSVLFSQAVQTMTTLTTSNLLPPLLLPLRHLQQFPSRTTRQTTQLLHLLFLPPHPTLNSPSPSQDKAPTMLPSVHSSLPHLPSQAQQPHHRHQTLHRQCRLLNHGQVDSRLHSPTTSHLSVPANHSRHLQWHLLVSSRRLEVLPSPRPVVMPLPLCCLAVTSRSRARPATRDLLWQTWPSKRLALVFGGRLVLPQHPLLKTVVKRLEEPWTICLD
ncbi:hypothetical protein E4T45_12378, partial [Aureobasidium sp. EXF-8846]